MIRQGELLEQVHAYNPGADDKLLQRAYDYGERMHGDQKRVSGEPYFSHPVAVANILTGLRGDLATIVTALLHDTIEDTEATYEEIQQLFGEEVATLVNGVTKLTRLELSSEDSAQAENFRKLLIATANDVRVLLVKLADRMHNMRTLSCLEPESKRLRIAQETMDIYAPLAGRMGVQGFREELEDRAFQYLNPEAHDALKERLQGIRDKSGQTIHAITRQLQNHFAEADINATVSSREKGLYAIWKKMERKSISLEQLCDITGFRIIVSAVEECYRALGIIHCTWQSVPGRFKDYISTPKANGYQSIQTTVIG
ncbi:MAG: HD domain-containing protein, partial [Hyphomicrobiales bacterium]|nr:HD domain-containing protein [Hyphomicrobiales bacterium]